MKRATVDIGTRCIAFNEGKILLQRGEGGSFRLPGGRLEKSESLEGCIERELWEELSINIKSKRLVYLVENMFIYRGNLRHEILFCYLCEIVGEINPRETHVKVSWANPREVLEKFRPTPLLQEIISDYELGKFEPKYLLVVNDMLVRRVRVGGASKTPGLQLRL